MNRPMTSAPWRCSSMAATEESTPPDIPTTTRSRKGRPLPEVCDELEAMAPPRQIVLHAAQNQRAAMARPRTAYFVRRHPQRAHHAAGQGAPGIAGTHLAGERTAQVG